MIRSLLGASLLVSVALVGCSSSDDDAGGDDDDLDLIANAVDNCPSVFNPDQAATLGDAFELGDACDDEDADAVVDAGDNCVLTANPDQSDADGDGVGDACEAEGRARLVADLQTGERTSARPIVGSDGKLFFQTFDVVNRFGVWMYDTRDSSAEITRLPFDPMQGVGRMTALDGKLYFCADDGPSGNELWSFDPARPAEPPVPAADIDPGAAGSDPCELAVLGDKLYFPASDAVHGRELWMYDPSRPSAGATLVADIDPTGGGGSPRRLMTHDGKLHFFAEDASGGLAPWVYEPGAGARSIGKPLPEIDAPPFGRTVILGDKLYFRWWLPPDVGKLWAYDLTDPDSGLTAQADVPGLFSDDDVDDLVGFGGKLYFSHTDPSGGAGLELWVFDPDDASAGIALAADIRPGRFGGRIQYPDGADLSMVELGGKLYMNADDGVAGHELMAYGDAGPAPGVSPVADIRPGPEAGHPLGLLAFDGKLYFSADDGVHGRELWEYDPEWRHSP